MTHSHIQMTQVFFGQQNASLLPSLRLPGLCQSLGMCQETSGVDLSDPVRSQKHRTNTPKKIGGYRRYIYLSLSLFIALSSRGIRVYLWNHPFYDVLLTIWTHEPGLATEVHTFHHWEALGRVAILVRQTCKNAKTQIQLQYINVYIIIYCKYTFIYCSIHLYIYNII